MNQRLVVALSGLCALAACEVFAPHDPALRLETLETRIAVGQDAEVRFTNLSDGSLLYNACYALLERLVQTEWRDMGAASGDVPCSDELRILLPAESGVVAFPLPLDLALGTYRYRFTAFYDETEGLLPVADRVTNRFSVVTGAY